MHLRHAPDFRSDFHLRAAFDGPINLLVKNILLITSLSVIAIFSSACNTTIGLGRDMRILGESMENQAQKTYHGEADTTEPPVY